MSEEKIKAGISIGDINGIGIEVILKTFLDQRMLQTCTPVIYGSARVIAFHRKALNINDLNYVQVASAEIAAEKKVNIINCWDEEVRV